jgi:hypothetical protein
MDRNGFMRNLTGINKYITLDESIVTIGISGINGQVELTEVISLEESKVIDVNLTSHEELKSSNFE